jgi:methionine-rich copper-binding protein CopC
MHVRLPMRLVLAMSIASLGLVVSAGLASAHARYDSSTPPANSTVTSLPSTLQTTFTEELASIKFTITGPSGAVVVDSPGTIDLSHRTNATVALTDGGAGQYTVVWHNVSGDDGDPNDGAFVFAVAGTPAATPAAPAPAPAPAPAANAPAAPSTAPAPAAPACVETGQVTRGITDVRVNTYCKRQAIREQYKGKIDEETFNELVAEGVGLESALAEAMEAMHQSPPATFRSGH